MSLSQCHLPSWYCTTSPETWTDWWSTALHGPGWGLTAPGVGGLSTRVPKRKTATTEPPPQTQNLNLRV